jgi:predicted RNA-binding Zn-ribbon protein involved in translation (DUF1610 family)
MSRLEFEGRRAGHANHATRNMAYYGVCTECDFLRVLGEHAHDLTLPKECPACGAEVIVVEQESRFEPTYVSRVSRAIHDSHL